MGYNYAHELKMFLARCKKLRIKYRMEGMSEEAINKILEFDYEQFKSDRKFYRHQHSEPLHLPDDILELIPASDEHSTYHSRYWWIDEIENPMILAYLYQLPLRDIELITLCIYEGYDQKEAAELIGLSESAVSYRINKIKKILKNISDYRI